MSSAPHVRVALDWPGMAHWNPYLATTGRNPDLFKLKKRAVAAHRRRNAAVSGTLPPQEIEFHSDTVFFTLLLHSSLHNSRP